MGDLKPCPFCGSAAERYAMAHRENFVEFGVRCSNSETCSARVSALVPAKKTWLKSVSAASRVTIAWNRRAGEVTADD